MFRFLPVILSIFSLINLSAWQARAAFLFQKISLPPQFYGTVINAVAYDQAGMLWFASNSGLHRYDGNQVISFNLHTIPAVDYTSVSRMMADNAGNLWLGGKNGLVRFDLKHWEVRHIPFSQAGNIAGEADRTIARIFQAKNGLLLAGTKGGGLFMIRNGQLEKLFDVKEFFGPGYVNYAVNQIVQSSDGDLWLGTGAGVLLQLDLSGKRKPVRYGLPAFRNENIYQMEYAPQSNEVLFNAQVGIYALNCKTKEIRRLEQRPFVSFFRMNNEAFLLSDSINDTNGRITVVNYPASRPADDILVPPIQLTAAAYWDNQALLTNGVALYTLTRQNTVIENLMDRDAATNSIRTIFKVSGNRLLLSSYQDQFVALDPVTGITHKINSLQPYCMMSWSPDSILIGEEGNGLSWYDDRDHRTTHIRLLPYKGEHDLMSNTFITCLCRETDSTVWAGTYQGIFLANVYKGYSRNVLQGPLVTAVQQSRVTDVLPLGRGRLLATSEGLFYFDPEHPVVRSFSDSLRRHTFYSLQKTGDKIWAASNDLGLVVLDTSGHVTSTIGRKEGLAGNTVFSLKRWHDYLVAGTEHGISILHLPGLQIHNYTVSDGLPSNECNTSAMLVSDSEVYVGTTNGLTIFNPAKLFKTKDDTLVLPLFVSALKVERPDGKTVVDYSLPYRAYDEITIPAGTDFFSITINTSRQAASGYEHCYYRLSDKESWHEITDRNDFSFVNMPPGTYRLELAAMAADGRLLQGLFSKQLYVAPLYYQTWWFRLLVWLLALGLAAFIVRIIIRYREKQSERERILRLKIAGDLHDEVGSMLTGMSLQADFLLQGHPNRQEEYLQNIAHAGRSAVSTMADIVWSIDPRNDDTLSLAAHLKSYAEKMLTPAGIRISFDQQGNKTPRHLPQRVRQNIMLIYKEALTNICKHAGAMRVHITLINEEQQIQIIVADNGRGMSAENAAGHGLRNMQMRANAIGAKLDFPETENGVTLQLAFKYT